MRNRMRWKRFENRRAKANECCKVWMCWRFSAHKYDLFFFFIIIILLIRVSFIQFLGTSAGRCSEGCSHSPCYYCLHRLNVDDRRWYSVAIVFMWRTYARYTLSIYFINKNFNHKSTKRRQKFLFIFVFCLSLQCYLFALPQFAKCCWNFFFVHSNFVLQFLGTASQTCSQFLFISFLPNRLISIFLVKSCITFIFRWGSPNTR